MKFVNSGKNEQNSHSSSLLAVYFDTNLINRDGQK